MPTDEQTEKENDATASKEIEWKTELPRAAEWAAATFELQKKLPRWCPEVGDGVPQGIAERESRDAATQSERAYLRMPVLGRSSDDWDNTPWDQAVLARMTLAGAIHGADARLLHSEWVVNMLGSNQWAPQVPTAPSGDVRANGPAPARSPRRDPYSELRLPVLVESSRAYRGRWQSLLARSARDLKRAGKMPGALPVFLRDLSMAILDHTPTELARPMQLNRERRKSALAVLKAIRLLEEALAAMPEDLGVEISRRGAGIVGQGEALATVGRGLITVPLDTVVGRGRSHIESLNRCLAPGPFDQVKPLDELRVSARAFLLRGTAVAAARITGPSRGVLASPTGPDFTLALQRAIERFPDADDARRRSPLHVLLQRMSSALEPASLLKTPRGRRPDSEEIRHLRDAVQTVVERQGLDKATSDALSQEWLQLIGAKAGADAMRHRKPRRRAKARP